MFRFVWFCLLFLVPAVVSADAVSGTYTGTVGMRGNYYFERSTRVLAPALSGRLDTPVGVRVEGTYLVDAITSASQATGVQSDVGFTEIRNDANLGTGYEFELPGATQLDISVRGRVSKEPDYFSRGGGFAAALSLFERTTILRLNGYFVHDDVARVERYSPADDVSALLAKRAVHVGTLDVVSLGLAIDQVLTRTSTLTLGFDESLLNGFTANPYRNVAFSNGGGRPEAHPDSRNRHAIYLNFAQYVTKTRSAVRANYRLYKDSWSILAHAAEVRVHQELGEALELRVRYRYYTQGGAFFFRKSGNLREDQFITADPKMSAFHDQTVGAQLRLSLSMLDFTALRRLSPAAIDFSFDYIFNTNRYGDGLMAQGGLVWPL